jgi:hypothetical protein
MDTKGSFPGAQGQLYLYLSPFVFYPGTILANRINVHDEIREVALEMMLL